MPEKSEPGSKYSIRKWLDYSKKRLTEYIFRGIFQCVSRSDFHISVGARNTSKRLNSNDLNDLVKINFSCLCFFCSFVSNPYKSIPMKKLVYSAGVIGFLVSCGSATDESATTETTDSIKQETVVVEQDPAPVNSFILESGVVGVFKIGQPISMPVELSSRKATVKRNGVDGAPQDHLQYVIFNSLEDVAEITMEKNDNLADEDLVIIDMRVISNYYETKDGVKVGSKVSRLTEKYSDTKFRYVGATGEIIGESNSLPGVQFVINPAGCTKKVSGTRDISLSSKNFSEEAKIEYINVF